MTKTLYALVGHGQFLRLAEDGQISKDALAAMLEPVSRRSFLDACAAIERGYSQACGSSGDPCLESGCSIDHEHGETCLQPLLRNEGEYLKACAAEWAKLFKDPKNRSGAWRGAA